MTIEDLTQKTKKPSRRRFLKGMLATIGAASAIGTYSFFNAGSNGSMPDYNSTEEVNSRTQDNSQEKNPIVYMPIFSRNLPNDWVSMVNNALYLDKSVWKGLPDNLTKQQLYDKIKDTPMMVVSTLKYTGTGRDGLATTNHDMLEKYMIDVRRFANMEKAPELDPELKFTQKDAKTIEDFVTPLFEQSPITKTLESPIILGAYGIGKTLAQKGKHFVYPAGSKIFSETTPEQMSTEIWVRDTTGKFAPKGEDYVKLPKRVLTQDERKVFERFGKLRLLCDVEIPAFKDLPPAIDILYEKYLENHPNTKPETKPKEKPEPKPKEPRRRRFFIRD